MVENLQTIEHDIVELERLLEQKRAVLGQEKHEKEILREVVGEKIQQHVPAYQPSQPAPQAPASVHAEPPNYLSQEFKDKIQEIVQIVFSRNLNEGLKEVAKTGNMALIDAFHDILVDELYNQLIEQRKLVKVK